VFYVCLRELIGCAASYEVGLCPIGRGVYSKSNLWRTTVYSKSNLWRARGLL
jgi:hypothetical protein